MIISASRRTDIPAFYATWFLNRVRQGYCFVPNPFNFSQIAHISLKPDDVEVIAFWTRNPLPLLPYLKELDERGFRYYFLYTVMKNPRQLDPGSPSIDVSLESFKQLAQTIGPEKVIWRYDPIVFTSLTGLEYHKSAFQSIAGALKGLTRQVVISTVSLYRKSAKRLQDLSKQGISLVEVDRHRLGELLVFLQSVASDNNMEIFSCAQPHGWEAYGIRQGKCINDQYIEKVFGIEVTHKKDPSQRKACGCVVSKDIGMYDSCLYGCKYCYATRNFELAKENYKKHDPSLPILIPLNSGKAWFPKPGLRHLERPQQDHAPS